MRALAFLALVAVACSKAAPKAVPQPAAHLSAPGFDLNADPVRKGEAGFFQGSSLIFAAHPDPEDLAKLFDEAVAMRRAKAAWIGFKAREIMPRTATIRRLTDERAAAETEAGRDPTVAHARAIAARRLWSDRLAALVAAGELDGGDVAQAERVFGAYCEAKIWELALSPLATRSDLTSAPTPLMLCQDVYAQRGLLSGTACAPAPEGKSYFECLWNDGVFRTQAFVGRYSGGFAARPTEIKEAKIRSWVNDGTLRAVVSGNDGATLAIYGLSQLRFSLSRILGRDYKDAFVPDGGTPAESSALSLADASPAMLIDVVEDGAKTSTPPALLLFPRRSDATAALTADLRDMAQRPGFGLSVSDFLFTTAQSPLEAPGKLAVVRERPSLAGIFASITPESAARLMALDTEIQATNAALADPTLVQAEAELFRTFASHLGASAVTASLTGVSDALWVNSTLDLNPANGETAVEFRLDNDQGGVLRVCWSLAAHHQTACPDREATQAGLLLRESATRISHDPETTLLTLEVDMEDPATFGFKLGQGSIAGGHGDPFSYLDPEGLKGKTLRLELYPSILDGMTFYSGALKVMAGSAVLHEGVVNLLANEAVAQER